MKKSIAILWGVLVIVLALGGYAIAGPILSDIVFSTGETDTLDITLTDLLQLLKNSCAILGRYLP